MPTEKTTLQDTTALTDAIREVLASTFNLPATDIHDSFTAAELPAWDSLHHFTLIVALEDHFGITYTSDEIPRMNSVPAITEITAHYIGLGKD
jgi:acyl carrier protein